MNTATDTRIFVLRAEAIRRSGLSRSELESLIRAGRVAVRKIAGTRDRVRLADVLVAANSSIVVAR
jgi:hypothetical protein